MTRVREMLSFETFYAGKLPTFALALQPAPIRPERSRMSLWL